MFTFVNPVWNTIEDGTDLASTWDAVHSSQSWWGGVVHIIMEHECDGICFGGPWRY